VPIFSTGLSCDRIETGHVAALGHDQIDFLGRLAANDSREESFRQCDTAEESNRPRQEPESGNAPIPEHPE